MVPELKEKAEQSRYGLGHKGSLAFITFYFTLAPHW